MNETHQMFRIHNPNNGMPALMRKTRGNEILRWCDAEGAGTPGSEGTLVGLGDSTSEGISVGAVH